jgi:ubiquinol-cytochrome c reductase cytochrome c1 subunit
LSRIEKPLPLPLDIDSYHHDRRKADRKGKTLAVLLLVFGSWGSALANSTAEPPPQVHWSFKGPFGVFDRAQLQRGFQVYKEVCSACHALEHLRYGHLTGLGFTEAEVKAIAASFQVPGPLNDEGEPTLRKGEPGDFFAKPFANPEAARAANNGSYPPDQSLIVKARHGGADYVRAILIGYEEAPANFHLMPGMNYNRYFEGKQIAMLAPLIPNRVTYSDGTEATVIQMAEDVTAFLAWAAEPEMEYRRQLGIKVIIFLGFFTILMFCLMRRTWAKIKKGS